MISMQAGAVIAPTTMPGFEQPDRECRVNPPVVLGLIAFLCIVLVVSFAPVDAQPAVRALARWVGGTGNKLFLVVGYAALLAICVKRRAWTGLRILFATVILITLVVQAQKYAFGYWLSRPNGAIDGFPSGHASAACALAFLLALYFPRWAVCGYAMAVAICWSRISAGAHWPYQVVVGAITGYVLALALTDKMVPYARHHRVILRWQNALVWLVPLAALCCTQHEYENSSRILWCTLPAITCGMTVRIRQYARMRAGMSGLCLHRRQRYLRYTANTLICAGVTLGTEIIWLVPLEVCLCLAAYALVERTWAAASEQAPPEGREERPANPACAVPQAPVPARGQREWVFDVAWMTLLLAAGVKEMLV